jgi:hypothetical protein
LTLTAELACEDFAAIAAPLFDESWYGSLYPDVVAAGVPGLVHYVTHGWLEGRNPHPLFDESWYGSLYPDVVAAGVPGLVHYVTHGWLEGRNPHPLFSTIWFRSTWKERLESENDLSQYLQFKAPHTVSPHPAVDEAWYRAKYLSDPVIRMTAIEHYARFGFREGNATSRDLSDFTFQKIERNLRGKTCA